MKGRKRQRLDADADSDNTKGTATKSTRSGKTVRLENLAWKEVEMPDRLDDFEGFYGLEEIDDIDVVREGDLLSFKKIEKVDSNGKDKKTKETEESDIEEDTEAEASEWSGFSDNDEDGQPDAEEQEKPAQTKAAAKKAEKKEKEKEKKKDKKEKQEKNKKAKQEPKKASNGHDVVGKASTGSGKTLAFGIPILESFLEARSTKKAPKSGEKTPTALILSPTRELAHQISQHLTDLCTSGSFDSPYIATITGGLSIQKQQRQLETADIVVGTPGRLWEVISNGHGILKRFKKIRFLVVDEADRLLSEGHFKEVEEIINVLERKDKEEVEDEEDGESEPEDKEDHSSQRQTLVFSATFNKGLQQKLAGKAKWHGELLSNKESMEYLLKKLNFREERPKFVDVNPVQQMAEGLKEGLVECGATEKDLYLYALLMLHPKTRTLVFTNSVSAVRRLHPFLTNLNMPTVALHSHMAQKQRLRSVERFSSQPGSILIATDVAARGLDIKGVELIIHYHLPRTADMYVHRSGRTARGDSSGSSILICAPDEVVGVRRLVAKVHASSNAPKSSYFMRSIDLDRRIVTRLKPRATLAKKIADADAAKTKSNSSENDLLRQGAEDLGIEYDSEELEKPMGRGGRGNGRKMKEREAKGLSKDEVRGMRAELKALLSQRVNVGVSPRYLTGGDVDIDALIREKESGRGEFLGRVDGIGL
ncbi:putative atp-dependent rna helicase mak5 protein [Neofusicoccum parvum UCRNP2]|uniref:RNA helicase n=1 Tax=Botryosphaeria parva (strain UCR-NP2) TaxID=1287680 RepID=R1EAR4_BOTPV|nr:putative atp-dependent rna helicase mak5 protein [Neofusicoccum parvum UCRNP2]